MLERELTVLQASQQKVDALVRLSNAEHVASNHSNQTQQLQEQIKDLQSRLTQVGRSQQTTHV